MDKSWAYGIDGWKVDSPEGNLPDPVETAAGPKTNREYGDAYYRAFYEYVRARRPGRDYHRPSVRWRDYLRAG